MRLPFSTERKYMATVANGELFVKGAPEIVLSMCELTREQEEEITNVLTSYQQRAMRTLAFACKPVESTDGLRLDELEFLGVCAISDPLRQDVAQAVADCQRAGTPAILHSVIKNSANTPQSPFKRVAIKPGRSATVKYGGMNE